MVEASATARDEATGGLDLIDKATAAMDAITAAFSEVSDSVTKLDGQFIQVEEIVDLIRAIAEQTNLLAFNAAIEAARAGEIGRGFAVVASEVKSLAEESATSTERIASIVGEMKNGVATTVRSATNGRVQIETGGEVVDSAGESFRTIAASVDEIDKRARNVQSATGRIKDEAEQIADKTKELAALAQSNSAVAEEVAASSEEATATAVELGGQAGAALRLIGTTGHYSGAASIWTDPARNLEVQAKTRSNPPPNRKTDPEWVPLFGSAEREGFEPCSPPHQHNNKPATSGTHHLSRRQKHAQITPACENRTLMGPVLRILAEREGFEPCSPPPHPTRQATLSPPHPGEGRNQTTDHQRRPRSIPQARTTAQIHTMNRREGPGWGPSLSIWRRGRDLNPRGSINPLLA